MHVQQDTPVASELQQLHMPISENSIVYYSLRFAKKMSNKLNILSRVNKIYKSNATYLSTFKSYKNRLTQCGYHLANIPMEGSDFSFLMSHSEDAWHVCASRCINTPRVRSSALLPLRCASIYSARTAVILSSIPPEALPPSMGGFYNPTALTYIGRNQICTVICVYLHFDC